MWRALAIWIVILNTSTITLSDAMLVVEVERADSVRVVFRLGDEWIGTDLVELRDTIRIEDNTKTFEVEVEFFE